jgi:uncharacterized heparinase superfamily protein
MTKTEKEMLVIAEAQLKAYENVMKDIADINEYQTTIAHEMRRTKACIEGRIIGTKNFIRSLK